MRGREARHVFLVVWLDHCETCLWRYKSLKIAHLMQGRDAGKMRQKGSASVPNVNLSRFAPPAMQWQAQAFPSSYLRPATAYTSVANGVAATPGSQPPSFPGSIIGAMPFSRPPSMQDTVQETSSVLLNGNQQGQQDILHRLTEIRQPAARPLPIDSAVEKQLPPLPPASPAAAGEPAEAAGPASDENTVEQNLPESANGTVHEEIVKAEVLEHAEQQPEQQIATPAEATAVEAGPSPVQRAQAEAISEAKDSAPEQAGPAETSNASAPASKKWTGLREAKSLVSVINDNAGLQLLG